MYVFGWFLTVPTCIPSIFLLVLAGIFLWTPALSIDNFFPNFWKEIYISENIPFSFEIVRDVGYVPVLKVVAHGAHVRGTKESWGDPKAGWLFLYLFSVKLAGLFQINVQSVFFNWAYPLDWPPPKNAWTGPPLNLVSMRITLRSSDT